MFQTNPRTINYSYSVTRILGIQLHVQGHSPADNSTILGISK